MEETDNICFVCDKNIPSEKWKYKLQVTATKKRNVPVADLIKQLVGDEFEVLVGERDAVCSRCMNLLNLMDSLTVQLVEVQSTLTKFLHCKYDLASDGIEFQVHYDNSILEEIEPIHKCESCSFETKYEKEFNKHLRTHEAAKDTTQTPSLEPENLKSPSKKKPIKKGSNATKKVPSVKTDIKNTPKVSPIKRTSINTPKVSLTKMSTRSTKSPVGKRKVVINTNTKKSPKNKSPPKKDSKKVNRQKKTKIVFQCSICDKIFPDENLIRTHAKKEHGNDNIIVSDDEYEDIQTLEPSFDETPVNNKPVAKKRSKRNKLPASIKPKLDFLDDWVEDENNDELSPSKIPKIQSKSPVTKRKRQGRAQKQNVDQVEEEDYDDDKDTSSNPTCLFCHVTFSSMESVQDHIKLSHGDRTHFNVSSKDVASPRSVASFEIDSTTDIVENKASALLDDVAHQFNTVKSYKCNLCGIKRVSLQFIQQHIKVHKKKISLQCKCCGASFRNIAALKLHASKCHKVASIPKKCVHCKFKFFDNIQLKNHIRKVHQRKLAKQNLAKRDSCKTGAFLGSTRSRVGTRLELSKNMNKSGLKKETRSNKKSSVSVTDSSKISFSEVSSTSLENETEPALQKDSSTLHKFETTTVSGMKKHVKQNSELNESEKKEKLSKLSLIKEKDKLNLKCEECGLTCGKPSRLLNHLNRHKANTCLSLGICFYCNKLFLDKDQAVIHINITHENVKIKPKCSVCSKTYSYAKDLKTHYLKAHFTENTEKLMKQVTEHKMVMKKHYVSLDSNEANDVYSKVFKELQDITGEGNDLEDEKSRVSSLSYNCPLCNFDSTVQDVVKGHLKSHTQNYCNICENIFNPQESIKHIENHSIDFQNKKCSSCEKKFHDDIHLQFHLQSVHPESKPHKCSMCIKSYFSEKSMLNHKQTKHGKKSKKVVSCNECKMQFYSDKAYQTHIEFAHRSSLNCKYCDKTFSDIKKLVLHERNHLKQVKSIYKCNICGKVLKTQSALKTHKINHASNKFQCCEICNQSFKSFHTLREHSAKHSQMEEKYFCDICGKGFHFYDSHQRHRRLHLDPLLFQCKICRERFQTNQKLIEHKETCKLGPKCNKCFKSFNMISDLNEHVCLKKKVLPSHRDSK